MLNTKVAETSAAPGRAEQDCPFPHPVPVLALTQLQLRLAPLAARARC